MNRHPLFCLALLALIALVAPMLARRQAEKDLSDCGQQLKDLQTALEMYSTDWSGRYPLEQALLTPNYLKAIPTCPTGQPYLYLSQSVPDSYTIGCSEPTHPQVLHAVQSCLDRP